MFIKTLKPLTNYDITKLAKELIKNFTWVLMRNTLPTNVKDNECGVINFKFTN